MSQILTDIDATKTFMLAGKAKLTVVSKKTGNRFTYKIVKSKNGSPAHFVSVFSDPNAEHGYTYMGMIKNDILSLTAKSKVPVTDLAWKAFDYVWKRIVANVNVDSVEVWHEGCCGRCGRTLTDPESIQRGIGPECIKKVSP